MNWSFATLPEAQAPTPNNPLSREELEAIREEAFADDVDIPEEAVNSWRRLQAVAFFEEGGRPPKRARILLLHGIGGNSKVIRWQTARVMHALGENSISADVFEGSVKAKAGDVDEATATFFGDMTETSFYRYYGVETEGIADTPEQPARTSKGWTRALLDWSVEFNYVGEQEALDGLDAHIEAHGPFDALWGFSQGGILITMLTARRLARAARGLGPPPSWRCNVLMSALPPRCGPFRPLPKPDKPPLAGFPAVSIVGREDPCYPNVLHLHNLYDRLCWLEHGGEHHAPTEKAMIDEFASAIWRTLGASFLFDGSRYEQ